MKCNVCHESFDEPVYCSGSHVSLTSLCELRSGQVSVWSCRHCGHLQSQALDDEASYYENDYKISLTEEDEDQIYEVVDGQSRFRTDHQLAVLLRKLPIKSGARVLDFGCAKASTTRKLLAVREDVQLHLFDVSDMYKPYWNSFVASDACATFVTPPSWNARFDVVTSFFALEHIGELSDTLTTIWQLLDVGGVFYGIVPDTFGNVADFVVVDHVNHFTAPSLQFLLSGSGFTDIEIDAQAHRGALVFTATKTQKVQSPVLAERGDVHERALALGQYWQSIDRCIAQAVAQQGDGEVAIYGAGFYGAYIASAIRSDINLVCFLDANPFQQGKKLFDIPILAPQSLPLSVSTLFVGLNPAIARQVIESMPWLTERGLSIIYLDNGSHD
ncbi:methyltransferase domain-containing protein [Pokkaliibacter sp. MBI-7]|uniref:class I SAM-dependent methyltransferase n=1 Tax=Pokkaliibacter sp. MBI-7 TaxID=3040600 RepID=UPI002449172B|nr:class I SAM-dependent methyltransferase [Pokkaliibacter sp. MBI-7]MDH2431284.1 methyltransferase domain-containing protein [Pokkaliibacter sp. MBI-7]